MAENSKIEWTDATWNIITGCTLVDEGCRKRAAADLAEEEAIMDMYKTALGMA